VNKLNPQWGYLGFADSKLIRQIDYGVVDLYCDPANLETLVGISTHRDTSEIGIFRSHDWGETWVPSDNGIRTEKYPKSSQVASLSGFPPPTNILLVGMSATIFKSSDGGRSWTHVWGNRDASGLGVNAIKFNARKSIEVWAGGETGRFAPFLLRSSNAGDSWYSLHPLPPLGPFGQDNAVFDIAVDPINDGTVYLAMIGIILKTTDNAVTWQQVASATGGFYRIELNPEDSQELFATGGYLYHTTDGASSWSKILPPEDSNYIHALAIDWKKKTVYVSASSPSNGIYKLLF
jgi:photosystem II stability/assembly factor-like uncharacterized protein